VKVGLVCPYSWDVPGGVRSHVADLAVALSDHGHEVSVLAPVEDATELPPWVVDGGRPTAIRYNGSVARLSFGVKATRRVRAWVRDGDFDIVHVHEPVAPSLSMLAVTSAYGPIVATFHSRRERSRIIDRMNAAVQTVIDKISARIAVSELARATLSEYFGVDSMVIPNGVAVDSYAHAHPLPGWPGAGGTIGFLGRLDEPRKGMPVLLEALPAVAARFPGLRVLVAGPGDQQACVAGLDASMRDRITFLGLVSEADKRRMLHSVDAYVAPNTGGESFGIVLLEAMASGTPVVASDLEAFSRVLGGGRAGVLFANEDPADLSRALCEVLGQPELRAHLAREGAAQVEQYDWGVVAAQLEDVYATVAAPGLPVREDSRGQVFGIYSRLKDDA
jgi:phosphatidyl-myo-inositol alpha-mannosyltransferase